MKDPKEYFAKSKEESLTPLKRNLKFLKNQVQRKFIIWNLMNNYKNLETIEFIDKILKN